MKQEFQLKKKYRKKFARSTACRRYLTRLSRKKDGVFLALLRRSRSIFRVSFWGRNRFFRCLWMKQIIFCGLAIIFSWTHGMSSAFSHLSRSVTEGGSSVGAGVVLGLVELEARRTTISWHCPKYVVLVDADSAFHRGLQHVQKRTWSRSSMVVL